MFIQLLPEIPFKFSFKTICKKKVENIGSFQGHTKNGTAHQLSVITRSFAKFADKSVSFPFLETESTGYMTQYQTVRRVGT